MIPLKKVNSWKHRAEWGCQGVGQQERSGQGTNVQLQVRSEDLTYGMVTKVKNLRSYKSESC